MAPVHETASPNETQLTTSGVTVLVRAQPAILDAVRVETAPFFTVQQPGETVLDLDVSIEAPAPDLVARFSGDVERVRVDTSLYAHLASDGARVELLDGWAVRIDATGSVVRFRHGGGASLFQPDPLLAVRDTVRLCKSVLTVAAERAGAVQLHASAVQTEEGTVLLLGDMCQGKTTLLLELLSEFNVNQLSCDTVLLRVLNGKLFCWGWPSPFSVSHGTLVDHAALANYLPHDREGVPYDTLWREGKKSVLTCQDVVKHFGSQLIPSSDRIAACLLLDYAPQAPTRIERVTEPDALVTALRKMYLGSRDPIYHNWHRWLTMDDSAIEANIDATAVVLAGTADLWHLTWAPGPASLMKRLPVLARAHPVLGPRHLYDQ